MKYHKHFRKKEQKKWTQEQIDLDNFQIRRLQYIAAAEAEQERGKC